MRQLRQLGRSHLGRYLITESPDLAESPDLGWSPDLLCPPLLEVINHI